MRPLPLVKDRTLIQRFNPDGFFSPIQYLARTMLEEEPFVWTTVRSEACIFENHLDAEKVAKAQTYTDDAGKEHEAVAVVIGDAVQEAERLRREEDRLAQLQPEHRAKVRVVSGADAQSRWEATHDL